MEDIIVIKRVGIIGMGALGMLYGDFIAKNITREAVTFIVDEKRKKAYQETVFTINGEKVLFNLVEYFNAVPFDLIIIAVKGTALEMFQTSLHPFPEQPHKLLFLSHSIH